VSDPEIPMTTTPLPEWHTIAASEAEARLATTPGGLSRDEARERLARYGPNELPEEPPPTALAVLVHQFQSPLIYILLVATIVTALLREYVDAAVIAAVLALNAAIGFTQERRAEASVRALTRLMAPRARVVREGRETEIEGRSLVPGDVVLLESGTRVPADLRLFATTGLVVDESLLTGESLPVKKATAALDRADRPLGDRRNMAYMGTIVATGRARGFVIATGPRTELGVIAEHVRAGGETETPLQRRMTRFAHVIGAVVAISAGLAFGIGVLMGESASHMFMVAVALAVSAVPEGLPVVFTITLALGVRRMARRNAIVRRLPAVETLGSTTVIGSDKTGTLTENRMTVTELWTGGRAIALADHVTGADSSHARDEDAALRLMLLAGTLANEAQLYGQGDAIEPHGDPTETALLVAAKRLGLDPAEARASYPVVREQPFEPERSYSAAICRQGDRYMEFVKGAPERVLSMCADQLGAAGVAALDADVVLRAADDMAVRGLRVLGMAFRVLPELPAQDADPTPEALTFLGLQGMMDPPRVGVQEAVDGCQRAGVRVIMITGDHAGTARAIGTQLGIAGPGAPVLTGVELERLDDAALGALVGRVPIYARVSPEHKLRVVQALRAGGEVVAVTGDGVNDAPALKAAEIGIAMGRSGTDVAREAADMVLADDNFVTIYAAVEEGRVTFDNLRKVTFFLVSTGAAEIVMILTALSLGWPLPLAAAQILWLNLVTNGLQDVALAFEPGEKGVLNRPPRPAAEGVMSRLLWERTLVSGLVMAAGTLALFTWEISAGSSIVRAQSVALSTMVLFQMVHVGNCRSETGSAFQRSPVSNPFLFVATTAALLIHLGAQHWGPLQFVLRVEPLEPAVWMRMVLVALSVLVAVEAHKVFRRPAESVIGVGHV
jgi:calcium-translocating P-type ATPase